MNTRTEALLQAAFQLPIATHGHFADQHRIPHGVDHELIRTISDTALRAKLINAGLAEGLQSPKGPQKIASIIRIYPDADAPSPRKMASVRTRPVGRPRMQQLPTVEELEALLTRIRAIEGHVAREMAMTIDQEIETLKQRVASAGHDELTAAMAQLGNALERKNNGGAHVRREALHRIAQDREFPQRAFLSLISA